MHGWRQTRIESRLIEAALPGCLADEQEWSRRKKKRPAVAGHWGGAGEAWCLFAFELVIDRADVDIAEVHPAARVVALEGDGAAGEFALASDVIRIFGVFHDGLAVDFDGDVVVFDDDLVEKPFLVFVRGLVIDIGDAVDTAGFDAVAVGGINLGFVADSRPTVCLPLSVEEDPRVGFRIGENFRAEVEIFEVGIGNRAVVKEVVARAVDDDFAVLNRVDVRVFLAWLPSAEVLAIEEREPLLAVDGHGFNFVGIGSGVGK